MKDLELELNELKKDNKIGVGVYQDKKLVSVWKDEKTNIMHLLSDLYNKYFLKNSNIKISKKHNCNDMQEIKVIEKRYNYDDTITTFEYIYYNVPVKYGYLDNLKISDKIR